MKLFYTGADGQLGKALALVAPEATGLDHTTLDLTWPADKIEATLLDLSPTVLINCAAYTAVDKAESEPDLADQINAKAVEAIAQACNKIDCKLIQVSTDYVLSSQHAHKEDEAPKPNSVYGRTKLGGEIAALKYEGNTVVRTSWVFGDGNNFVQTMLKLGATRDEVSVVSDQIGRPTYAPDLAKALLEITGMGDTPKILHYQNTGPVISWADFAEMIFDQAKLNCRVNRISAVEYAASRGDQPTANRPANSAFDLGLQQEMNLPNRDYTLALQEYLRQLRALA